VKIRITYSIEKEEPHNTKYKPTTKRKEKKREREREKEKENGQK